MRRLAALGALVLTATSAAAGEHDFVRTGDAPRATCATPSANWQRADFDDRGWTQRLMTVRDPNAKPAAAAATAATMTSDDDEPFPVEARPPKSQPPPDCLGARFARWHFTVAELRNLQTITLRIRYTHGFAAYLNGVELARRRLDANAPPDALAGDVHGPEAERLIIPLRPGLLRRGDNVLAVEVHPHTAQRESQMEVALFADDSPRIVRGPYLLNARSNEVTVVFDTDLPTVGELRLGPSDAYGWRRSDALGTHHVLRADGLHAATLYHYRVRARAGTARVAPPPRRAVYADSRAPLPRSLSGDPAERADENAAGDDKSDDDDDAMLADSGDAQFHTPPDAGRPLRFAVYGDVRSGHDIHATLNRALADDDPDFAILTGDLVDRGSDEGDWERFFEVAGALLRQLPIYPAIGNHEYARQGHGALAFMQLFRFPVAGETEPAWYSFDVGAAHFVALDSNQYKTSRQLSWLDHDLKEARKRGTRVIFVFAHEGPYSSGMHGDNGVCAHDYVPLFERYHISMLFTGHDHDFERGRVNSLDYVVTGGGGAELRTPRCGVPGKKTCPPRVISFANDHNYVMVELLPSLFRVCPKHVDGTPLEACTVYPLR